MIKKQQEGQAPILKLRQCKMLTRKNKSKFSTGQARVVETRKAKALKNPSFTTGQAMLTLVLLVGGAVVLIGGTIAFLVFSFQTSTFGFQAANRALGVALGGANDALVQLSRNREFHSSADYSGDCTYNFKIGDDTALVTVLQEDSQCPGNEPAVGSKQAFVYSEATILGRRRKINMIVSVDRSTGEVRVVSIKQEVGTYGTGGGWNESKT